MAWTDHQALTRAISIHMNQRKPTSERLKWLARRVRGLYRLLRAEFASKTGKEHCGIFVQELEPRVLYDASPLGAAFPSDPTEPPELPDSTLYPETDLSLPFAWTANPLAPEFWDEPPLPLPQEQNTLSLPPAESVELIAIDTRLLNQESLLDNLMALDDGSKSIEVLVIDPETNGINLLSERLKNTRNVGAVHLIALQDASGTHLGQSDLGPDAISGLSSTLTLWRQALDPDASVLLYGWWEQTGSSTLRLAEQTLLWSEPGIEDGLSIFGFTDQAPADYLFLDEPTEKPLAQLETDLESLLGVSAELTTGWLDAQKLSVTGAAWSGAFEPNRDDWSDLPSQTVSINTIEAAVNAAAPEPRRELVVIDSHLPDFAQLHALWQQASSDEVYYSILTLDSASDGLLFVTDYLAQSGESFSAIHLVTHGFAGGLTLGNTTLTSGSLSQYADDLNTWHLNLTADADLFLYGCYIADGSGGQTFIDNLSRALGRDVAASTDATGSSQLGGNWALEYQVGQIQTGTSLLVGDSWNHLLLTYTVADNFSVAAYNNNDGTNNWSGNWTENDDGTGATGGSILVTGGQLSVSPTTLGEWVSRQANLATAHSATLSFTFDSTLDNQADPVAVTLEISSNGGTNWTTLDTFSQTLNTAAGSKSYDITSYISANTTIRFYVSDNDGSAVNLFVDNLQISFDINTAPTAVADTATAAEAGGVNNGTAGTNPTGNVLTNDTDADSGDTKTVTGVAAGTVGSASGNVGTSVTGSFGSISIAANGSYTYTVDNNNATVQALRTSGNTLTDTFTYTMRDTLGLTSTTQITVTIQGANDAPTDITGTLTIAENSANGTAAGTVTGVDIDSGDTRTWSLTDNAGGRFAINSSTGQVTVANSSLLNFESATSHNITIRVMDTAGAFFDKSLTVTVTDQNEFSVGSVTDSNAAANTIAENSANGSLVGITASASDADGSNNTITYSLDNSASGRFAINSSTGVVTVADGTLLNFEAASSHSITVRATSSDGSFSTTNLTINVTDVNEAPTITNGATHTLTSTTEDATSSGTLASAILTGVSWAMVHPEAGKHFRASTK